MEIKGIDAECKNLVLADAFKRAGYKLREKRLSWPRLKGPVAIRVDCSTQHAVAFISRQELSESLAK
jgi:hypothetical protein